jgi:hypothetical protein
MFATKLENSEKNYPRKLLMRKNWLSLNGEWKFRLDHEQKYQEPEEISEWPLTIKVPFAPECPASGVGDNGFHSRVWYQRTFEFYKTDLRVLLHFGAVDYKARVWLNGHYLGMHEGGHTPFSFDITDELKSGGEQLLVVCADDDPLDLTKPRGKQDWQLAPHSIWYPRTTGIWQTVWIEEVAQNYIERLRITPILERWEISVEAFITGPSEELKLEVILRCHGRILSRDLYDVLSKEVHRKIAMSDPGIDDYRNELLWSPEKPTLIDVELKLIDGGKILDHVASYTALRSVAMSRDRFLLNGRPYYMRLVLDQGYWPETYMTPPSVEAIRKDIELTKAAGFNGVRKHQKVEDPDFLYWADVMGLMVWGEMPSAYRFTHESVERLTREWLEVIDRDMSHPCIVVWVPFNESWGVPDLAEKAAHQHCVQAIYHLTKTLDPTRPCIGNDGWESTATDIVGIHDYDSQPSRLLKKYAGSLASVEEIFHRYRPAGRVITVEGFPHGGQPVMLTEFGGISFVDHSTVTNTWGYSTSANAEDFRDRYEALLAAVHRIEIFAGFCYTQLTDTFQETNGLFRADRTPKFSINSMARATRGVEDVRGELTSSPQPPPLPPPEIEGLS